MFQTKVAEKIKTHILFSIIIFSKIMPFYDIKWKKYDSVIRTQK